MSLVATVEETERSPYTTIYDIGTRIQQICAGFMESMRSKPVQAPEKKARCESFTTNHVYRCADYREAVSAFHAGATARPEPFEMLVVELKEGDAREIFAPIHIGGEVFSAPAQSTYGYLGTPEQIGIIRDVIHERLLYSDSRARIGRGRIREKFVSVQGGKSQEGSDVRKEVAYTAWPQNDDYYVYPEHKALETARQYPTPCVFSSSRS
ncbi:hypothetical protein HY489_01285 [Candidatus Woesearchaeota archaeon]|nr:hypothetical protein [Candidatus Woesearchaeota archaeon]